MAEQHAPDPIERRTGRLRRSPKPQDSPPEAPDAPQDLSKCNVPPKLETAATEMLSPSAIDKMILSPSFVDNFSLQNLHLAHLAFYQQNPFYYQNLYPFLSSQGIPIHRADMMQAHLDQQQSVQQQQQLLQQQKSVGASSGSVSTAIASTASAISPPANGPLDLLNMSNELLVAAATAAMTTAKRPLPSCGSDEPAAVHPKKMAKIASAAAAAKLSNFKMFKDEPIPHGYLKFRFNEDCNFTNCGYRNHQSHFHCCRNDCYYSFCDKTRFVQHTARHERLDKLMGDDFKQFRANMRCGYDECVYNKNMGKFIYFIFNTRNFVAIFELSKIFSNFQKSFRPFKKVFELSKLFSNFQKGFQTFEINFDISKIPAN